LAVPTTCPKQTVGTTDFPAVFYFRPAPPVKVNRNL